MNAFRNLILLTLSCLLLLLAGCGPEATGESAGEEPDGSLLIDSAFDADAVLDRAVFLRHGYRPLPPGVRILLLGFALHDVAGFDDAVGVRACGAMNQQERYYHGG